MTLTKIQTAEAERNKISTAINALQSALTDHSTTPLLFTEAEFYTNWATQLQNELVLNLEKIMLCTPTDPNPYQQEFYRLHRQVIRLHSSFHGIKMSFPQPVPVTSVTSSVAVPHHDVKLPKLEIPAFHGDLQQWISFRDMFTATVHSKTSLSNVEKLTYLKSYVQGEAAAQLQDLLLSEANYGIAWKALTDRYNNERELLFTAANRLFNQPAISVASGSSIRSLVDTTKSCIRTMDSLCIQTEHCNPLLLYLVFEKLDSQTKELWLQSLQNKSIPDLNDFFTFLEQRAVSLVAGGSYQENKQRNVPARQARTHYTYPSVPCSLNCPEPHRLFHCPEFQKLQVEQRIDHVKRFNFCFNCLAKGHNSALCKGSNCKTCGKKHNTLLHLTQPPRLPDNPSNNQGGDNSTVNTHFGSEITDIPTSVLATAIVKVDGSHGMLVGRALLDSGSTTSYVTESYARKLGLRIHPSAVEVIGLSSTSVGETVGVTQLQFSPHFSSTEKFTITALVISKITSKLPSSPLSATSWSHLHHIELADPQFHTPGNIDILIGADLFWTILRSEKICASSQEPVAINSKLGWLVSGKIGQKPKAQHATFITNIQLDKQIQRFWSQEEIKEENIKTPEEQKCEDVFKSTVSRLASGRFLVQVPWKNNVSKIGNSREHAVRRLKEMERRLHSVSQVEHKKEYISFMREYETLGHMSRVVSELGSLKPVYYIPHHYVLKADSTTTKFRVVFDASAKSSSGISLNDAMMVGPVMQSSLYNIIMRFRLNPIAFTSDIAKMYRQVLLRDEDRDLHRILWREDQTDTIQEFRLNTVTYGTAAAPYLATRCLIQLAKEESENYPVACKLLERDCYVDDLMSGTKSVDTAKDVVQQIIKVGDSAGFSFRKWSCNSEDVLKSIPPELKECKPLVPMDDDALIKTLGIFWNPKQDMYQFKITITKDKIVALTKRNILSEMSKLFDPMGWLSPVTIKAKLLMQEIWKREINWDEPVPEYIQQQWLQYIDMLPLLEQLSIPRYFPHHTCNTIHLLGFCDASEKAMAAVVYLYGVKFDGGTHICLLTSKTRVAPINATTLPRLELNAAVLLADLIITVKSALEIKLDSVQAFSDSTITLGWIRSDANRWKTYVKNRVSKIQSTLPAACWSHVKGTENPADCASRGLYANEILQHNLWWSSNVSVIKTSTFTEEIDFAPVAGEERKIATVFHHSPRIQFDFITRFSTYQGLLRFIALILRKQHNLKARKVSGQYWLGTFSVFELNNAKIELVKCIQSTSFSSELEILGCSPPGELQKKNRLLTLNPFVDSNGVLCVGGRLRHARVPLHQKHPILLPKGHHFTVLIIQNIHVKNYHCGTQQTLALLNQHFWVVNGREVVRNIVKKCVVCRRHQAKLLNQQMGDLPEARVNPSRAFLKVGIDYCGPFTLRNFGRSKITYKVYLSVFVCLITRAIHIEVVGAMSTDAFLAAFRRFISRRGRPSDVFSDCGTNFVGADKALREVFALHNRDQTSIYNAAFKEGIVWHFNPPGAPHMGGLWEAGVKSIKYPLRRVVGSSQLTLEEFNTLIVQIEGILNSRPITPVSSDPNDLKALTPAHFLIGDSILSLPDQDLSDVNVGRLDRYQLIQQKQQSFWRRWSMEFISRMQQRPKWMQQTRPMQLNDVVIIKDETQPPAKWKLGRVIHLHPGADGLVRVVTLKTTSGDLKRPVNKLCMLVDNFNVPISD